VWVTFRQKSHSNHSRLRQVLNNKEKENRAEKMKSISKKITLISGVAIVFTALMLIIISSITTYQTQIDSVGEKAEMSAISISAFLDGDLAEKIISSANETGELPPEYKDAYNLDKQNLDQALAELMKGDAVYLYVMTPVGDDGLTHYYISAEDGEEPLDFWSEEDAYEVFDAELFDNVIAKGETFSGGIYESEGYGKCLSGYAPLYNSKGDIVAGVGLDFTAEYITSEVQSFLFICIIGAVVVLIIELILIAQVIKKIVTKPIAQVTEYAKIIATGNTDIIIDTNGNDEIAELKKSFAELVESTKQQAEGIEQISEGNLRTDIQKRSNADTVGNSMSKMEENLRGLISKIRDNSIAVTSQSDSLDNDCEEFSQTIQESINAVSDLKTTAENFLEEINAIAEKTNAVAKNDMKTMEVINNGRTKMNDLSDAVLEIKESGEKIEAVIKLIDDIAFQTNILALNASVEAARAGEHGKGFAVVAAEVRNLAAKSANAAKDTQELISITVDKAVAGVAVCNETSVYFDKISGTVDNLNKEIFALSEEIRSLDTHINAINDDISNIGGFTEQNGESIRRITDMSLQLKQISHDLNSQTEIFTL
jgi:methyl-accepting chemotaxis protein